MSTAPEPKSYKLESNMRPKSFCFCFTGADKSNLLLTFPIMNKNVLGIKSCNLAAQVCLLCLGVCVF